MTKPTTSKRFQNFIKNKPFLVLQGDTYSDDYGYDAFINDQKKHYKKAIMISSFWDWAELKGVDTSISLSDSKLRMLRLEKNIHDFELFEKIHGTEFNMNEDELVPAHKFMGMSITWNENVAELYCNYNSFDILIEETK